MAPNSDKRHRHQDDERIAEAFELRGQHEVDDQHGQAKRDQQGVAGNLFLPRLADIVDEEAGGITSRAICSISARPSALVTVGSGTAEMVAELSWLNCSMAAGAGAGLEADRADSGIIDPDWRSHIVLAQQFGIETVLLRDLRDHVIAAVFAIKLRDTCALPTSAPSVDPISLTGMPSEAARSRSMMMRAAASRTTWSSAPR
jgi:hypothetical protein